MRCGRCRMRDGLAPQADACLCAYGRMRCACACVHDDTIAWESIAQVYLANLLREAFEKQNQVCPPPASTAAHRRLAGDAPRSPHTSGLGVARMLSNTCTRTCTIKPQWVRANSLAHATWQRCRLYVVRCTVSVTRRPAHRRIVYSIGSVQVVFSGVLRTRPDIELAFDEGGCASALSTVLTLPQHGGRTYDAAGARARFGFAV